MNSRLKMKLRKRKLDMQAEISDNRTSDLGDSNDGKKIGMVQGFRMAFSDLVSINRNSQRTGDLI